MNNEKNNGGPAFPTTEHQHTDTGHYEVTLYGMTLRDYFAAKAMQGALSNKGTKQIADFDQGAFDEIAQASYSMADAMLKAREQ